MRYEDLPQRWKDVLGRKLTAHDFNSDPVVIGFEDGSEVRFYWAFYMRPITLPCLGETLVLTEHCGYHIFQSNSYETITGNKKRSLD